MLFWIVDHASTFYWLLIFVAAGFVIAWYLTKRAKFLAFAGGVVGVMAVLFLLTRIVVSDRQQIENNLREMASAVVEGKADRLTKHFAKGFTHTGIPGEVAGPALVKLARQHGVNDIHLWDFDCPELDREQKRAKMNFNVRVRGGSDTWGAVRARSVFVLEGDTWKLQDISFHRLIGKNEEPISIPLR